MTIGPDYDEEAAADALVHGPWPFTGGRLEFSARPLHRADARHFARLFGMRRRRASCQNDLIRLLPSLARRFPCFRRWSWWRRVDSNHLPADYETAALAG